MRLLLTALVALNLAACAHSEATASSTATPAQAVAPAPTPTAEARKLAADADQLAGSDTPAAALPLFRKAWELGVRTSDMTYNAACAAALAGEKAESLTWLERTADAGFSDTAHLKKDPDLASVRAEPGFARIAEKVAANDAKNNEAQDPALRDELVKMGEEDQAVRWEAGRANFQNKEVNERMATVDRKNTARMKEVIAQKGWPGRTLVGKRGAQVAWLLVQHADLDPAFQKQCLPLLEKAVAQGEAEGKQLAYFTDRVLVADKKPQRYGTQFATVDGKLVPRPIEDEAHVDERRAAVGLGTMAEYTAQMLRMQQMNTGSSGNTAK